MQATIDILRVNEDWLLARIIQYARAQGYSQFDPGQGEPWRPGIQGLNQSLAESAQRYASPPELGCCQEYGDDPLTRFGVLETQRHRKRGVTLAMFLGMMKYFRQGYVDFLTERQPDRLALARPFLDRCFDRIEIVCCQEWAGMTDEQRLRELQASNREIVKEKNAYLTVFESLMDPAILVDGALRIVNLNHAAVLLTGRHDRPGDAGPTAGTVDCPAPPQSHDRRTPLIGQELVRLFPWLADLPHLGESMASSRGGHAQCQRTAAGQTRFYEATWSNLFDNSTHGTALVLLLRDITEYKAVEADLKQRETALQSIFRAAPVGIGLVVNRVLRQVNDRVCDICGYRREELLGQSARMLYPTQEEFDRVVREKCRQIGEKGTGTVETRWQCKDGRIIDVLLSSTPLDVLDLTQGATFSAMDITGQKRTMKELQGVLAALSATNRELDQFAYSVSHDLKNPLITVKGMTDWIKQSIARGNYDTLKDDFAFIDRACRQMEHLLDGLLQLSRLGRTVGETVAVDMNGVVREALEVCRGRLMQRGVAAEVAGQLAAVKGDPLRLRQVWENLIGNAVKFMGDQPHPRIEIGMTPGSPDETVFYIRDNGLGLEPRYFEKIFQPFNRLHSEIEGSGLGLPMVRRIIQAYHGRIWVESPGPKQGCTFFFTLGTIDQ